MKNSGKAQLLLALIILARSTSYLFSKLCMESMGSFAILSLRFWIAFLLLAVLFYKKLRAIDRQTWGCGAALGLMFFLVMAAEMLGLRTTASSVTALLENTSIVLVPIAELLILGRKMPATAMVGCVMAFGGVVLLTDQGSGFTMTTGIVFCLLSAVFYTFATILTDRLSKRRDPLVLGILQVGFMALFSTIAAFAAERPVLPQSPAQWGAILYLAVVCSGFGFTLQPVAQKNLTAQRTALLCALNPVSAALLGVAFLHETVTPIGIAGMVLILFSVFLPFFFHRKEPKVIHRFQTRS